MVTLHQEDSNQNVILRESQPHLLSRPVLVHPGMSLPVDKNVIYTNAENTSTRTYPLCDRAVALVPHQHHLYMTGGGVGTNLIEPVPHVAEGALVTHVIHDNHTMGVSVVRGRHHMEALLPYPYKNFITTG